MANPFLNWTPEQVEAHNARVARGRNLSARSEDVKASKAPAAGYGAEMQNDVPSGTREHDGRGRKEGEVTKSDWRNRGTSGGALNITKAAPKKKALLNKTETLWKAELERRGHKIILVQALTFRLGDRLNYRPDLVTIIPDHVGFGFMMTCYETKAPHRFAEKGVVKIKAAAKQFPFIRFVLVMRKGGQWTEREIGSE